jgi:hypothetical protein
MDKAVSVIAEYPAAALAYQVQDPRMMALLRAMATQLSMRSQEQDVAAAEPFTKSRDMTVLANAAVMGVLPFASPAVMSLSVENVSSVAFDALSSRRVLDQQGRNYVTTKGATVPAGGSATIEVVQRSEASFSHTVTASQAFYSIPVPAPEVGYITDIRVSDDSGNLYTYTPEFTNIELDAQIYHLESDEYRQISVVFGARFIGGYQPVIGDVFNITVVTTEGEISLSAGAPFVFEHATTIAESGAKLTLTAVQSTGSNPLDVSALRYVTNYPALYDKSAVYLGNFDFLVRGTLSPFRFLSVWNEQREEEVRGASQSNINCLFVAAQKDGVSDDTLHEQIAQLIKKADNSYRYRRVAVAEVPIPVTVTLSIPDVYEREAVKKQAAEIILAQYGRESVWAKKGSGRVLIRRITTLLQTQIVACQAEDADIKVVVTDEATIYPESYRYISADSLVVNVVTL